MNNLEKHFVNYQQSVELKSIKFNEPCLGYYNCERDFIFVQGKTNFLNCEIPRPLKSQVFEWGRKEYNKLLGIDHSLINGWYFVIREIGGTTDPMLTAVSVGDFKNYEEAESSCIDKLIEICLYK